MTDPVAYPALVDGFFSCVPASPWPVSTSPLLSGDLCADVVLVRPPPGCLHQLQAQ